MKLWFITLLTSASCALGGMEFEAKLVEVEAAADDEQAQVEFKFSNTGDKEVIISHIDPDCDCLTVQASGGTTLPNRTIRYRPGESGVIRSIFKIGNSTGTVDQVVAIWLKGDPKKDPSIRLTARIKVPQLVHMEPRTLKWQLGSEATPQRITISMNHDKPIEVTKMECTSPSFRTELKTVEAGKLYEVLVTPVSTETPGIGVVQIETDCEVEKQRRQQAFIMIQREE